MWPLLLLGGVAFFLFGSKRSSSLDELVVNGAEPVEQPRARVWPVEPYRGLVPGNGFKASRKVPGTDKPRYHAGIDIMANQGDRVVALDDGEVLHMATGYELLAGLQGVAVAHPDADYIYAELDVKVKPGQKLKAGDLIGIVRRNGTSNTSMLHLEAWEKGKAPRGWTSWTPDSGRPAGLLDVSEKIKALQSETGHVA